MSTDSAESNSRLDLLNRLANTPIRQPKVVTKIKPSQGTTDCVNAVDKNSVDSCELPNVYKKCYTDNTLEEQMSDKYKRQMDEEIRDLTKDKPCPPPTSTKAPGASSPATIPASLSEFALTAIGLGVMCTI